jgi:hypothetical protein
LSKSAPLQKTSSKQCVRPRPHYLICTDLHQIVIKNARKHLDLSFFIHKKPGLVTLSLVLAGAMFVFVFPAIEIVATNFRHILNICSFNYQSRRTKIDLFCVQITFQKVARSTSKFVFARARAPMAIPDELSCLY